MILENIDLLVKRRTELSMMQNIPDMRSYAQSWLDLALSFEASGMLSNAEYCKSRGEHYAAMDGGEYIRLIDSPVTELLFVE